MLGRSNVHSNCSHIVKLHTPKKQNIFACFLVSLRPPPSLPLPPLVRSYPCAPVAIIFSRSVSLLPLTLLLNQPLTSCRSLFLRFVLPLHTLFPYTLSAIDSSMICLFLAVHSLFPCTFGKQFRFHAVQSERDSVLHDFKAGKSLILVATDVAARGLDVKDIRMVINFDFPNEMEVGTL